MLAAYADLLLALGEGQQVRQLLAGYRRQDSLLLRLTLAEHRAGQAGDDVAARNAEQQLRYLALRFAEMRQRADRSHLRDEARMQLELRGDAPAALALMSESWATQRDPVDAELFLLAARLAGRPRAAEAVVRWLDTTGVRDQRLEHERDAWHHLPPAR